MAPGRSQAPAERPYGLTDFEATLAMHACKLFAETGLNVDKQRLAELTGHANPDSANRIWYLLKNKLLAGVPASASANASPTGGAGASGTSASPSKTPTKKAAKKGPSKTGSAKKRTKQQQQQQAEDGGGGGGVDAPEKGPKRLKKERDFDIRVDDDVKEEDGKVSDLESSPEV